MSKRTPEDKSIVRAKVNLGKAISKCRSNQKTQRQLALAIGLPPSNLKYIEDGVNAPTAEVYSRLINELKPTVEMRNRMDLLNDSFGNCCVNVHFVLLSSCGEHSKCGRMKCSPVCFATFVGAFAGMLW